SLLPLENQNGGYVLGGMVNLAVTSDLVQARRSFFHELTHWVHREGPVWYRELIRKHFEARTAGDAQVHLTGYGSTTVGKRDHWYDQYAGRIYDWETQPGGLEVPTRHMELLSLPSEKLARHWNDAFVQDSLLTTLRILF